MEKNLKSVKLIAQILRIICLIGFICCIIGAVGGLIGAIIVGAFWGDENIRKLVFDTSGVDISFKVALCSCICATIICAVSAVVVWFAYKLYEEIKLSETPFTRKVAKDMLNLGIMHLIMAVGSAIVCGIITLCFGADVDVSNGDMFLFGLIYIVISFVFAYGADVVENKQAQKVECECGKDNKGACVNVSNGSENKVASDEVKVEDVAKTIK